MSRVQKITTLLFLAASVALACHATQSFTALLLFFFVGLVPGTSIVLAPYVSIALLGVIGLSVMILFIVHVARSSAASRSHTLPERRFGTI